MVVNKKILEKISKHKVDIAEALYIYCLGSLDLDLLSSYAASNFTISKLNYKNYITKDRELTESGKKLYNSIFKEVDPEHELSFEDFWLKFPPSDKWGNFIMTRALRANKVKCKKLYISILEEGEFTHEQIISALEKEVTLKKQCSSRDNNMKYMQNCSTWLNNRTFESWIKDDVVFVPNKEIIEKHIF